MREESYKTCVNEITRKLNKRYSDGKGRNKIISICKGFLYVENPKDSTQTIRTNK